MSNVDDSKGFYGLTMQPKLKSEEKQIAKIRENENEKRKRKEKLYSYCPESHTVCKNP